MKQNEKVKRAFIAQTIVVLQQNESVLKEAGFDPATRIAGLSEKQETAENAEGKQQEAQVAALEATKTSNEALKVAYDDASSIVSLIEGLLGKDSALVHKLHQMRK